MPKNQAARAQGVDLDEYERPDKPGPLPIKIGGRTYQAVDPEELDFRELLEFLEAFNKGNSIKAVYVMIPEEDQEAFFKNKLPPYKLEKMATSYIEHYGLQSSGEADASLPS